MFWNCKDINVLTFYSEFQLKIDFQQVPKILILAGLRKNLVKAICCKNATSWRPQVNRELSEKYIKILKFATCSEKFTAGCARDRLTVPCSSPLFVIVR